MLLVLMHLEIQKLSGARGMGSYGGILKEMGLF
jgi:hypothetical protein